MSVTAAAFTQQTKNSLFGEEVDANLLQGVCQLALMLSIFGVVKLHQGVSGREHRLPQRGMSLKDCTFSQWTLASLGLTLPAC